MADGGIGNRAEEREWWVFLGLVIATVVVMTLMNLTGIAGQRLGVPV